MIKNRIEQLVEQAHQNMCNAGKEVEFNYNFADEFASLIIGECMKVVDDQIKDLKGNIKINPNSYEHGYISCGVDSYVAIRQHFYPIEE